MDGSYGNVFGGGPPMSPDTPTSSSEQYKVNVSRQKTRKWAEFKPQNYDGDDWGADYDDGPEEPPPPPPLKPMGPRQPSAPLPTSRQLAPGGPSLQLQTHRAVSTPGGPVSAGGALERTGMEPLVSPQSAIPQSAAATMSSVHSGNTPPGSAHPGAAQPPRTRSPAAPLGTGSIPSRFPPRKSSLGPQDAPAPPVGSAPLSGSSSRPGSSRGGPRNEGRSTSPANPRSPLSSPTKLLPFIRPADIYRRMEEEKEKERERRSMESAGRTSLDGVPSSPAPRTQAEASEQNLRAEESADGGRSLPRSLPPVAERRSEYGLEGLIASYGSEDMVLDSEPTASEIASTAPQQTKPRSVLPSQSPVPVGAAADNTRRFSTSPKLPELGRMSGFGDDLFSMSSGPPSMPSMPDGYRSPATISQPVAPQAEPAQAETAGHTHDASDVVQAGAAVRPTETATENRSASPPNQPRQPVRPSSPQQHDPAASRQTTSLTEDKQAARPSLPGGWVSETTATPTEVPTPIISDPSLSVAGKPTGPSQVSSIIEPEERTESPLSQTNPSDALGETAVAKQQSPVPSHQGSPIALPSLGSASPARSTSQPMTPTKVVQAHAQAADLSPSSPVQTVATMHDAEIAPTAPLNPSRSLQDVDPPAGFAPPDALGFESGSALDTTSNSPIKESDVLREEIMKSLSPLSPSNDHIAASGVSTAAYHAAAGSPVRESSYLGDVYGDYWAATEDKPGPGSIATGNKTESAKPTEPVAAGLDAEVSSTATPSKATQSGEISHPSTVSPGPEKQTGDLRRRFSWETAADGSSPPVVPPAATDSPMEQNSLAAEAVNAAQLEPSPPSTSRAQPASLAVPTVETTVVTSSQEPPAIISHQVSGASTIPPGTNRDVPIELPSPISMHSERHGSSFEARRQSVAEEKVLIQSPTKLLSPSLPLDQHPGAITEPQPLPSSQTAPATPTRGDTINLMTFRQIMDLPSPMERAKLFSQTRSQFAAMDTGLEEWMLAMTTQHPEHANSTWSFRAGLVGPGSIVDPHQGGQAASQANSQTLFSQQHPNASTIGFGRPAANMPIPPTPPHGPSAFGHSGAHVQVAQVGTKSKKLLMAAGKAGKGLLNKGKNKLSGTGDRAFFNT